MPSINSASVRLLTMALALFLCSAQARAVAPEIARKHCPNCQKTASGQTPRISDAHAASFFRIANDPAMNNGNHLAYVISQYHARMPPFAMTATGRQELITYIQTFRTQPNSLPARRQIGHHRVVLFSAWA
jgi:hypothetical protein